MASGSFDRGSPEGTAGPPYESLRHFVETALSDSVSYRRQSLAAHAHLFEFRADAPIPDPAIPELGIHLLLDGALSYEADFSFGRFKGLKRRGDFDVTPPGVGGSFEASGDFRLLTLTIPWATMQQLAYSEAGLTLGDLGPLHSRMSRCPTVANLLQSLWRNSHDDTRLSALYSESAVQTVALRVLDLAARAPASPSRAAPLSPSNVRKVTDLLEATLDEDHSLAALAALVGLSPGHFLKAFKAAIGVPPHRYLMARRIQKARLLLSETKLSIGDIAATVGYADVAYFTRLFRTETGLPPAQWRRERAR